MTIEQAKSLRDQRVEYRAFTGSVVSTVTITDVRETFVMVQFDGCGYSRSVHPRDLSAVMADVA